MRKSWSRVHSERAYLVPSHRQLFRPLLWLPLASFGLLPQCVDSLKERCDLTLTCPEETSSNGQAGNGQAGNGSGARTDAGQNRLLDGGLLPPEGDCVQLGCDGSLVCDSASEQCFECLEDQDCGLGGDASTSAASSHACSPQSHSCVECTEDSHCSGDTPYCDLSNERCVECVQMGQCTDSSKPACNQQAGVCTATCKNDSECNEPIGRCLTDSELCVECLEDSHCDNGQQCNLDSHQCVTCVNASACSGATPVCDPGKNECVSCLESSSCNTPGLGVCSQSTSSCVQCTSSGQCSEAGAARCNLETNACDTCTDDIQCSVPGAPHCRDNDGRCVQCENNLHCSPWAADTAICETGTGSCVECTNSSECSEVDEARCDTNSWRCSGCTNDSHCDNVGNGSLFCRDGDGLCVTCRGDSDCKSANASRCNGGGSCSECQEDSDCNHISGLQACKTTGFNNQCVQCVDDGDCGGATPACDIDTNQCVPCVNNSHCGGSTPFCDVGPQVCVECLLDSQCDSANASRCASNRNCEPCRPGQNNDCQGITDDGTALLLCDGSQGSGECVQCTGLNFDACDGNVCDSLARSCSEESIGSAGECTQCIAGNHCGAGLECIRDRFDGTDLPNFRCFPVPAAQTECAISPPFTARTNSSDIDGRAVVTCQLGPASSCASVEDTRERKSCLLNSECGEANGDGVCFGATVCFLPCRPGNDFDCLTGTSCQSEVCIPG